MGPPGLTGEQGERGKEGPRGPRGEAGIAFDFDGSLRDGPDAYVPRLWMSCSRALDLTSVETAMPEPDGIADTVVSYTLTIFEGGDAQTDCKVERGAASASGGTYYPSATAGAAEAICLASTDLPPVDAVAGRWQFTTSAGGPSVTYLDDPSHPLHGETTAYREDDCVVLRSDIVGEWEELSFASFFN
jgi:hypothetical protein